MTYLVRNTMKIVQEYAKKSKKKHYFWWLYCRNILKEMYGVEALWGCFCGGRRLTRERRTNARKDGLNSRGCLTANGRDTCPYTFRPLFLLKYAPQPKLWNEVSLLVILNSVAFLSLKVRKVAQFWWKLAGLAGKSQTAPRVFFFFIIF